MLSQDLIGPESSLNMEIDTPAMKGKMPKRRLMSLYFPVLCIIQPANKEPADIDMLLGSRCNPKTSCQLYLEVDRMQQN